MTESTPINTEDKAERASRSPDGRRQTLRQPQCPPA